MRRKQQIEVLKGQLADAVQDRDRIHQTMVTAVKERDEANAEIVKLNNDLRLTLVVSDTFRAENDSLLKSFSALGPRVAAIEAAVVKPKRTRKPAAKKAVKKTAVKRPARKRPAAKATK